MRWEILHSSGKRGNINGDRISKKYIWSVRIFSLFQNRISGSFSLVTSVLKFYSSNKHTECFHVLFRFIHVSLKINSTNFLKLWKWELPCSNLPFFFSLLLVCLLPVVLLPKRKRLYYQLFLTFPNCICKSIFYNRRGLGI